MLRFPDRIKLLCTVFMVPDFLPILWWGILSGQDWEAEGVVAYESECNFSNKLNWNDLNQF